MYICLCNAIKLGEMSESIKIAKTPADVMKSFGCNFQCGKCQPVIEELIEEYNEKQSLE